METDVLKIPHSQLIRHLKSLPRRKLIDIFSEVIVSYDYKPLTETEKQSIKEAMIDYKNGELIDWENIK